MTEDEEVIRWSASDEGQFFERKSAFERSNSQPRRRNVREIAWDIVETLAAMANADGGELVIGIEDNGDLTGVPHPEDRLTLLRHAGEQPQYVTPPLRYRVQDVKTTGGELLLHFSIDWSPQVHQLADGRYLLRVGDSNVPFNAQRIEALKATKEQGLTERSFPPGAALDDLNLDLVHALTDRLGGGSAEEILRRFRLVEGRNDRTVPNLAGLLLFGKDPPRWHPRCGIDVVRWEGTERRFGADLNIANRILVEQPLAILAERAYDTIRPYIRERQQLQDLFFTERLEYPTFVWQEALVNAVAHRDYGIQGAQIEVWMFDDRLEVRSPGLPPHPVTVEALNRRERLHLSRNPIIMRVLASLGYVQELGEGIPRMFNVMEREGFYPPGFESIGSAFFAVTLRNEPVYDRATLEWLQQFDVLDLTGDQKRLLAYARAHDGAFTSREYQKLVGIDLYAASNSIKALIRKGLVRSTGKGSRTYEVLLSGTQSQTPPEEFQQLLPMLQTNGSIRNTDVRDTLGLSYKTASRLLDRLVSEGWLERVGERRGTRYTVPRGEYGTPSR